MRPPTQLRESWETREETLNSKQNEEAVTTEVHAQAKQDLADTESKVASYKNFLTTHEDDDDAGGLRVVPCPWRGWHRSLEYTAAQAAVAEGCLRHHQDGPRQYRAHDPRSG